MATLTETAYFARKGVNIGVVLLVLIVILRVIFSVASGVWQSLFPAPPPPATVAFGKLPYPNAQNEVATPSAYTYTLETVDGSLPALPTTYKVYFMTRPGAAFGSYERMKASALKIGFSDIPRKVKGTLWKFTDKDSSLRTLDIDEVSGNFRLSYNYLSDLSLFNQKNFSSQEQVISSGQGFFDTLGIFTDSLKGGSPTVAFFRLDAGALLPATSLSNADAISVTFNRADIVDGKVSLPIVSPDPRQGLVSVLFSGSGDQKKKVLEARYFYTDVDLENWATYPLVKSADAFNKLKSGKAIFASLSSNSGNNITIRKVYVAYLDPYPSQSYMQPVLVFSDEKGFLAYVPIVSGEWLE